MASEKRMDVVILGFLSHESMTGYEIKKRIDTALRYFWSGSFTAKGHEHLKEWLEAPVVKDELHYENGVKKRKEFFCLNLQTQNDRRN